MASSITAGACRASGRRRRARDPAAKGRQHSADEVFMTIVRAGPVTVRATVDEKDRSLVAVGAACKVTPTALPDLKLAAKIERISRVPIGGSFEVIVTFDAPPADAVVARHDLLREGGDLHKSGCGDGSRPSRCSTTRSTRTGIMFTRPAPADRKSGS